MRPGKVSLLSHTNGTRAIEQQVGHFPCTQLTWVHPPVLCTVPQALPGVSP